MYVLDALARHSKHISQLNKHTLQQTEYNAARKDVEKLLIDQPNADINELVQQCWRKIAKFRWVRFTLDQFLPVHARQFCSLCNNYMPISGTIGISVLRGEQLRSDWSAGRLAWSLPSGPQHIIKSPFIRCIAPRTDWQQMV